jgi:hypothetical protein
MSTPQDSTISHESLDAVIAGYMLAVEAGEVPDRGKLLDRHPDYVETLSRPQRGPLVSRCGRLVLSPAQPPRHEHVGGRVGDDRAGDAEGDKVEEAIGASPVHVPGFRVAQDE